MTKEELSVLLESWDNLPLVISTIETQQQNYKILMGIALYSADANSWRAAYIVDKIHEKNPDYILPYVNKITEQLKVENHAGKKRHFLKQISLCPISSKHYGFLFEYCLNALGSAKERAAVRVHAMQILFNISEKEPELKPEILALIEHEMEYHSTAGIISRGRKLANKLRKQIS